MSDSNDLRSSNPLTIPSKSRDYLDPRYLSTTPGGTLYSTTPGGTRIVYDKEMLLQLQNSPMSKSPINISHFPGLTKNTNENEISRKVVPKKEEDLTTQDVFKMD